MQQCIRQALRSTRVADTPQCLSKRHAIWRSIGQARRTLSTDHRNLDGPGWLQATEHGTAIPRPSRQGGRDIQAWMTRLEPAIPSKYRQVATTDSAATQSHTGVMPSDFLSFILAARQRKNHDILLELSRRGKWRELVWLVTYIIDGVWKGNLTASWKLPDSPFGQVASLDDLLETSVNLQKPECNSGASLDKCLLGEHPFSRGQMRQTVQGHQALGEIWQSLGCIIIEDAAKGRDIVQPEILELIAVLHARGIMPDSIYSYSPDRSHIAGTQPPTLRLLSSQIMANLSDATWNARQASVIEGARSSGRNKHLDGPELPSSYYRVRVAGIRHEIWLELVLWSCLHGGWTTYGSAIVEELIKSKEQRWLPLSWRETMSPTIKVGEEPKIDWERVEYLFTHSQTQAASRAPHSESKADRTISSEVISAYVDATVNLLSTGVGERGVELGKTLTLLLGMKRYLSDHNFGLESTSWDAVMQRILESESIDMEQAPGFAELLLSLSASYGDEEASQYQPTREEAWRPKIPYLADGSALSLGLAHRTLSSYIHRGEFAAAFRTFRELQARTDDNKRRSLAAFFQSLKDGQHEVDSTAVSFTSSVASITHPGTFTMLPATVLSPFMDLISDVKAFEFGSWLVASQDIDGPTIGPLAYRNPIMVPSLIKFLAASGNEELLRKTLQTIRNDPRHRGLPAEVLLAILESQFLLNNSKAAVATFETIFKTCSLSTSTTEGLLAVLSSEFVKSADQSSVTKEKLLACLRGEHKMERRVRRNIVAILMHIDEKTKELCRDAISLPENIVVFPEAKSFNLILDAHTSRNGSEAGRSLVCTFSPMARQALSDDLPADEDEPLAGIRPTRGKTRPDSLHARDPDSLDLTIAGARREDRQSTSTSVRVTGRFRPTISTVRIVLSKRLEELRSDEGAEPETDGTVAWAKRLLMKMGMRPEDIRQEITGQYGQTRMAE